MAIRREAVGVALLTLTASTIFTLFIIGEKAVRMVEVVENVYPDEIRTDQWNVFSVSVIARKPVKYLEIEFRSLHVIGIGDVGPEAGRFGLEGLLSLGHFSDLLRMAQSIGMDPVEFEMEVELNGRKHDIYVIDFTEGLQPLVEAAVLGDYSGSGVTATVYAAIYNETGLVRLYAGTKDYFPRRNMTINELTIGLNDEKSSYKRAKDLSSSQISAQVPTLVDAPEFGSIRFSDLKKDDIVRVAFSVDASASPYSNNLQIIRIAADCRVEEEIANFVSRG